MDMLRVRKQRVYQAIVKQIKTSIEKGEIVYGEKFPSERNLAAELAVSRTSVKEAFSVLESAGIVEIKKGSGVYLRKNNQEDIITKMNAILQGVPVDIVELMELRLAIEQHAAYYAAERGSDEEIQDIYHSYLDLEKAVVIDHVAAEEDLKFHMAVAKAAGNSVMEKVMHMLSDQVLEGLKETRSKTLEVSKKSQVILKEHERIYKAIKDGDAVRAQKAMGEHLLNVKERYL